MQQQHITDKDIILKWVHQFFLCSISHAWTDTDIILIAGAERSRGVVLGGAQVPSAVTDLARLGSFDQRGGGGECQDGPPLWRLNVDLQVRPSAMSLSSFWSFDQREGGDECLNALRHWFLFLVFFWVAGVCCETWWRKSGQFNAQFWNTGRETWFKVSAGHKFGRNLMAIWGLGVITKQLTWIEKGFFVMRPEKCETQFLCLVGWSCSHRPKELKLPKKVWSHQCHKCLQALYSRK